MTRRDDAPIGRSGRSASRCAGFCGVARAEAELPAQPPRLCNLGGNREYGNSVRTRHEGGKSRVDLLSSIFIVVDDGYAAQSIQAVEVVEIKCSAKSAPHIKLPTRPAAHHGFHLRSSDWIAPRAAHRCGRGGEQQDLRRERRRLDVPEGRRRRGRRLDDVVVREPHRFLRGVQAS